MSTFLRPWSELPADILSLVSNCVDYEIDHLRFRSVCPSWRSSIPPRPTKFSFPLRLPMPSLTPISFTFNSRTKKKNICCNLEETIFYRLSPPSHVADPSNGWLFRVYQTNPNTFALKHPTLPDSFSCPPGVLPTRINLLDYRVSEVCRSYCLKVNDATSAARFPHKKVITRRDEAANCDFAVLILTYSGLMSYWRLGDEDWTSIDVEGFKFHDIILHQGMFYAIDGLGTLVCFDSEFNMSVAAPAARFVCAQYQLVEFGSELYLVSRSFPVINLIVKLDLNVSMFNKCNGKWDPPTTDLGDAVFIMGVDASFGVSTKDFHGCKGNRLYLCEYDYSSNTMSSTVYLLDEGRSVILSKAEDFGEMFLPGTWLSTATSSNF